MMARLYDVITFDCYGTLIDWEGGISTAFASAAAAEARQLDRTQMLKAYAEL
jgi:FMN phosphatase YigB (HAD superfamily)